ncbi:alpha/beta hydrolase [Massilia sp. TWP1-3-3]|uniref:alpha/beta hydrolase n=1 Tax=Massilia sp. TWP1-3-3 TaxID=2804573 RepID=UPI003CE6D4AF
MRALPVLLIAAALSGCGTMEVGERNFIKPDKPGTPAAAHLDAAKHLGAGVLRDEEIATPDGAVLRGIRFQPPGATRAVLYFGGNMFHLDQHGAELLPLLASCGTGVAVFDYRGYGRSSGQPNMQRMAADAVRLYDHVSAQFPGGVIVHGQSLGSILAAYVAQQRPSARGIVLESTTSNVQDWVDAAVPWYVTLVSEVKVEAGLRALDNVAAMGGYGGTSLVLVGGADKVTPPPLARKVFDAIPGQRKQWHLAPGAGHNDTFGRPDVMPVYCKLVRES